nr:hypothetical protein CFP56_67877 [Quercus suber]
MKNHTQQMKNPGADEPSADSDQTPTSKKRIQAPILTKPRRISHGRSRNPNNQASKPHAAFPSAPNQNDRNGCRRKEQHAGAA